MNTPKIITSAIAALVLSGVAAQAQTYSYTPGDLLAAFRTASGANNVIVDLGSASNFQAGNSYSVDLTPVLNSTFSSTSGLFWSVFGYVNSPSSSIAPQNTLFVTEARTDITTQNTPFNSASTFSQGSVVGKMNAIADGASSAFAVVYDNQIVQVSSSLNVGGDPVSYTVGFGPNHNFLNTFSEDPENQTGGSPTVSDLFQQNPGSANVGNYLGSFAMNGGILSFSPVPEPSTWLMFGSGTLALLAFRRRR